MSPLNLKAFQQEIEQKADELASLPGVIGRVSFQSDKSRKKEITQLEAALGRPLPIFIRAYYEQIGRLNISLDFGHFRP
jgi:hypothetical protein